ncbi:hypothetical protein, partial [Variovorax sp. KBW07]|uniref:hypothetical protein n=1 Tax=Variovorax sp. KBW07 TaxID=2153358 RepID=UPI001C8A4F70
PPQDTTPIAVTPKSPRTRAPKKTVHPKTTVKGTPPDSSKFGQDHPFQQLDEEPLKPEKPE